MVSAMEIARHRIDISWRLRVAQVPTGDPTFLADLPENCPRLSSSTTVVTVLVRLTELAALVLPVRWMSHGSSDP